MMHVSIQRSMITLMILLIFLLSVGFFLYTVNIIVDQQIEQGFSDLYHTLQMMERMPRQHGALLSRIALEQEEVTGAHVVIVDDQFRLLADSHLGMQDVSGAYLNADISEAKQHGASSSIVRDRSRGALLVSVAMSSTLGQQQVIVSHSYSLDHTEGFMRGFLIFMVLLALLLAALTALLVSEALLRYQKPLQKFLTHTRSLPKDGHSPLPVDTHVPELHQLVENFNTLQERYMQLIETDNEKYSKINTLLATVKTGIIMVGVDNEITLVNPKAEGLLQVNTRELFTGSTQEHDPDSLIGRILSQMKLVNAEQQGRVISLEGEDKKIIDVDIAVMYNKYQPHEHCGALAILRDVTQIRHLERLKDEFVSNVSHELRTPLTVISGFAETLQSWELLEDTDRRTALSLISMETDRLKDLISELLKLSRIEGAMGTAKKQLFDPLPLIEKLTASLAEVTQKRGIRTIISTEGAVPLLYGRPGWFRQMIFNIYDNAVKYAPDLDEILIRVHTREQQLIIEVEDHGMGMAPEDLPRIFERFYRADKSRNSRVPGTGLGLAITQRLVKEFGGTIDVTSTRGRGTCFTVRIPAEDPRKTARSTDSPEPRS